MTFILGEKKQQKALAQNGHNLEGIKKDYWEIEKYTIRFDNQIIEKERFRFPVKQILQKYNIESNIHLKFLLSKIAQKEGICMFCKKEIFVYSTRNTPDIRSCYCKGICKACRKPYQYASHQILETCMDCEHRQRDAQKALEKKIDGIPNDDVLYSIAFHADANALIYPHKYSDVEKVVVIMKKRLKFLESYLKFRNTDDT